MRLAHAPVTFLKDPHHVIVRLKLIGCLGLRVLVLLPGWPISLSSQRWLRRPKFVYVVVLALRPGSPQEDNFVDFAFLWNVCSSSLIIYVSKDNIKYLCQNSANWIIWIKPSTNRIIGGE